MAKAKTSAKKEATKTLKSTACIFCQISSGKIPAHVVYEDKDFLAFLDILPLNPGHTLIIPKKHYKWVWDVPNIDIYYKAVGKVANALRRAFKTEWVVSIVFGEQVPHAHVWLVPRFANDGHGGAINLLLRRKIPETEMKKISDMIKKAL